MIARALSILAAAALAGCATPAHFAEQSHKANLAVEQAQNNVLLLNVVRAYHRRPMHFTGMQNIKGPIGDGIPSFAFKFPFLGPDRDAAGKGKIWELSGSWKPDGPSFDVSVWDGQEFERGINTQVDAKTFVYYLNQGWPQQMILHLLVREIRVLDAKNNTLEAFVNYPENRNDFELFQRVARTFEDCEFSLKADDTKDAPYGPMLLAPPFDKLEGIAALKAQGLAIKAVHDPGDKDLKAELRRVIGHQVVKKAEPNSFRFQKRKLSGGECQPLQGIAIADAKPTAGSNALRHSFSQQSVFTTVPPDETGKVTTPDAGGAGEALTLVFFLRSPEAALYYLGELARARIDGTFPSVDGQRPPMTAMIRVGSPREPKDQILFVVEKNSLEDATHAASAVTYGKDTFWIPASPEAAGRSMHAFSLLHQLINLQKKATDLPASTTVRVITP